MNKIIINNINLIALGLILNVAVFAQGHGHNYHNGRTHYEDWPDSLKTISVTGKVSVDNSVMMPIYYLETNGDDSTDFTLGFGPWWYEPESGAVRPTDGDVVNILGGVDNTIIPAMLVVFEIDGLVWRDPNNAPPWSGGWIHNDANDTSRVFCPTDSLDHIGFPHNGMNGMMGNMGTTWPDSVYCQFEQIHIDSLPSSPGQDMFEAYLCNFNDSFGGHFNMQGQYNGQNMHQGMMNFNHAIHFQFHYDEDVLTDKGMDENSIRMFYMDDQENWMEETDIEIDFTNNYISLNNSDVAEYYALQASTGKVGIEDENTSNIPRTISIDSVYPNPFNPVTKINYTVMQSATVTMQIFDINGTFVNEIVNNYRNPGNYSVQWSGTNALGQNVPSGTYFIKLFTGNNVYSTKITLLR